MKLPSWALKVGKALLVVSFILIGFFALMPRRSLGYIAEAQIEKATSFQYDVHVGGAALSGLSGVKASDIRLRSRAEVSPNVAPGTLDVSRLKVNAGLFSLIRRQPSARARIDFPTGHARVLVRQNKEGKHLELQFFDVSLMEIGILRDKARMPLRGTLRGTIDGTLDHDNLLTAAHVDMNVLGLIVGPRVITGSDLPAEVGRFFSGEINIPALHAGDILARAAINEEGILEIEELLGQGDDLRLNGEGRIVPKAPLNASELALQISIAVDPEWVDKAQIGALISGVPMITEAQQGENLVFALTGPLGKPKFAAAGARRRVR